MGRVIMSGIVPTLKAPVTGVLAQDIAVGSVVKLMESGTAVEYLVVNQGKPSGSSLYDDSCDGTWLLRKDCAGTIAWNSSNYSNDYAKSTSNAYLNNDFFELFGPTEKSTIRQVKIPYRAGSGTGSAVTSGASGLPVKVFYLSFTEVGFNYSNSSFYTLAPVEGAKLAYFSDDASRIAMNAGTASGWNLRTPYIHSSSSGLETRLLVGSAGSDFHTANDKTYGNRPAIVIPSDTLFDASTLILKGVA